MKHNRHYRYQVTIKQKNEMKKILVFI